jgi:hypothetical protein
LRPCGPDRPEFDIPASAATVVLIDSNVRSPSLAEDELLSAGYS